MNKFEFRKFKKWFFEQTETHVRNNNKEITTIQVPYYQLSDTNGCLRECGHGRNYQFDSWKYFTKFGNKNFIINDNYIEFDTPVDENGNTYCNSVACNMFYGGGVPGHYDVIRKPDGSLGRGAYHETPKHTGNYKHVKIHYKKFCYPLSRHSEFPHDNVNNLYWTV